MPRQTANAPHRLALYLIAMVAMPGLMIGLGHGQRGRADETNLDASRPTADRVAAFIPLAASTRSEKIDVATPDAATAANPPDKLDAIWSAYIAMWKAHHDAPSATELRTLFNLPADESILVTTRRGRIAPRELDWRPGSFRVWQTDHFEILSRADDDASRRIAESLERVHWVWTQVFFPLWSSRDQVALLMRGWNRETTSAVDHLKSLDTVPRLATKQRHRIVLLPDGPTYQSTVAAAFGGVDASAVAASTGFYSDTMKLSFFYPQDDLASLHHEVCHQLFSEATDSRLSRRPRGKSSGLSNDPAFWLIEGIAGHFESLRLDGDHAVVGGWDSSRLQFARYQVLIGGVAIAMEDELAGTRDIIQARDGLAMWYTQSILRTHFLMDGQSFANRRALLKRLARIYSVSKDDAALTPPNINPADVVRFLRVDDERLLTSSCAGKPLTLCLAGCDVTGQGLASLPELRGLTWCDLSRLPITDTDVTRLIGDVASMDQLSLEATRVTSSIMNLIAPARLMRELDLSHTAVDDSAIASIPPSVSTLWLTGSKITDSSIDGLLRLPNLKTIDVQRTLMTDAGLQRLQAGLPDANVNPLTIR